MQEAAVYARVSSGAQDVDVVHRSSTQGIEGIRYQT